MLRGFLASGISRTRSTWSKPFSSEAFFTSTSPCVLPVTLVDKRPIGDGAPGPVVRRLLGTWSEIVGVDIVKQAAEYAPRERLESKAGS